jgi:hypothetical protein
MIPCEACTHTVPACYCTTCKVAWDSEVETRREQRRVKLREKGARCRQRKRQLLPSRVCAVDCGTDITARRRDAMFCSSACRSRAYRRGAHAQ